MQIAYNTSTTLACAQPPHLQMFKIPAPCITLLLLMGTSCTRLSCCNALPSLEQLSVLATRQYLYNCSWIPLGPSSAVCRA